MKTTKQSTALQQLADRAYALFFHSTNLGYESYSYRNCGCPVRAVRVP